MTTDTLKFIEHTKYYIWWLKNCSQKVSPLQIRADVNAILKQVDFQNIEDDTLLEELDFFFDLSQLMNYDIKMFIEFYDSMEKQFCLSYLDCQ